MNTWRYRKIMLRLVQISDIFRAVFGDGAMMSRVRPLYEWQYDNANDTARLALTFADRYFNNGDGQTHVASPAPGQPLALGRRRRVLLRRGQRQWPDHAAPQFRFRAARTSPRPATSRPRPAATGISPAPAGIARDGGSQ